MSIISIFAGYYKTVSPIMKPMKNIIIRFSTFLFAMGLSGLTSVSAANRTDEDENRSKGYLTGSFETNTNLYHEDVKTSATVPDGKFGSNNYLKLDYYNNRFSAGVQMEAYTPALVGYSSELKGANLTNYYVNWTDDSFSVTAGTFYEQFGSGLLFRSWEDRALGLNNAVMGARVSYSYEDILNVKALWGMPRFGMKFSGTQVKGADLSFALSNLLRWESAYLALEGSVLDRYEAMDADRLSDGCKPNNTGWSARANMETNGFFLKAEYVGAGTKYYYNTAYAGEGQMYHRKKGNAQLVETGYNGHGPIFMEIIIQKIAVNSANRSLIYPANLINATVVSNYQSTTVNIDSLSDRIIVKQACFVDLNLNGCGFILHNHGFVEVSSLIGTNHHCFHNKGFRRATNGIHFLCIVIYIYNILDCFVGFRSGISRNNKLRFFPFVFTRIKGKE